MCINSKMVSSISVAGLSFLAMTNISASAATVTFNLSFFNETNEFVGSGEFSYDDEALACLQAVYDYVEPCSPDSPNSDPEYDDVYGPTTFFENPLTSFSADIDGLEWNFYDPFFYWYAAEDQQPGYLGSSRYSGSEIVPGWFFGDEFFGTEVLVMFFTQFSNTSAQGTWLQSSVYIEPFYYSEGTWTADRVSFIPPSSPEVPGATSVPESSTGLASLVTVSIIGHGLQQLKRKI